MKSFIYAALLAVGLLTVTSNAFAWGSLAIDSNQGSAYGFSYDYATREAADGRALKECGYGCRIVGSFAQGCGAYAADQAPGGSAAGWGTGMVDSDAKATALGYCRQSGGTECIIRVWSCHTPPN